VTDERIQGEEHTHDGVSHDHAHYHVTHNFFERAGAFEHLGYRHGHPHDHRAERHAHYPHQDFDAEHVGEAHEHAHSAAPVRRAAAKRAAPVKKAVAKKTAPPA
jgi:hypothetical protein